MADFDPEQYAVDGPPTDFDPEQYAVDTPELVTSDGRFRILDGDTVEDTQSGERIRLGQVNTNEVTHEDPETGKRTTGEVLSVEAAQRLKELLDRAGDRLVVDRQGEDAYGRTVAELRTPGGQSINASLVEELLARPADYADTGEAYNEARLRARHRYLTQPDDPAVQRIRSIPKSDAPRRVEYWRPEPTTPQVMGDAVRRGTDTMQAGLYGFANAIGEATGIDAVALWGEDGLRRNIREAMENPAQVPTTDDIDGLGDAATYVGEKLFENLPGMATMMTPGGLGAAAARQVVGRRLVKRATDDMLKNGFARSTARDVAERAARRPGGSGQAAMGRAAKRGATAGMAAGAYPQHVGEVQGEFLEAGIDAPETALAAGIPRAILDTLGVERIITRMFPGVPVDSAKDLVQDVGKALGFGTTVEASTESLQELIGIAARAYEDPDFRVVTDENLRRLKEAGVAGGVVGGVMGGAGRLATGGVELARAGGRRQDAPAPEEPAEPTEDLDAEANPVSTEDLDDAANPVSAPGQAETLPEDPDVIERDLAHIGRGERKAVFIESPGEGQADDLAARGYAVLPTADGQLVVTTPEHQEEVAQMLEDGRLGEALGYGVPEKPQNPESPAVISVRDADDQPTGHNVVVDEADGESTARAEAAAESLAEDIGGTVTRPSPEDVIRERVAALRERTRAPAPAEPEEADFDPADYEVPSPEPEAAEPEVPSTSNEDALASAMDKLARMRMNADHEGRGLSWEAILDSRILTRAERDALHQKALDEGYTDDTDLLEADESRSAPDVDDEANPDFGASVSGTSYQEGMTERERESVLHLSAKGNTGSNTPWTREAEPDVDPDEHGWSSDTGSIQKRKAELEARHPQSEFTVVRRPNGTYVIRELLPPDASPNELAIRRKAESALSDNARARNFNLKMRDASGKRRHANAMTIAQLGALLESAQHDGARGGLVGAVRDYFFAGLFYLEEQMGVRLDQELSKQHPVYRTRNGVTLTIGDLYRVSAEIDASVQEYETTAALLKKVSERELPRDAVDAVLTYYGERARAGSSRHADRLEEWGALSGDRNRTRRTVAKNIGQVRSALRDDLGTLRRHLESIGVSVTDGRDDVRPETEGFDGRTDIERMSDGARDTTPMRDRTGEHQGDDPLQSGPLTESEARAAAKLYTEQAKVGATYEGDNATLAELARVASTLLSRLGLPIEAQIVDEAGLRRLIEGGHRMKDRFRETLENPPRGRIFYSSQGGRLRPVIFVQSRDPDPAFVLMHELGHLVDDAVIRTLSPRLRKQIRDEFGNNREALANNFAAWVAQRRGPRTAVEAVFARMRDALRQLWRYLRGHARQAPSFRAFLDALHTQATGRVDPEAGPLDTELGREMLEAVRNIRREDTLRPIKGGPRDFHPPEWTSHERVQALRESAVQFGQNFLRAWERTGGVLFRSQDGWLRRQNVPVLTRLADHYRRPPGQTRDERSIDIGDIPTEMRRTLGPYRVRIERIIQSLSNGRNKTEAAAHEAMTVSALLDETRTSEQLRDAGLKEAAEVRALLDDLYRYLQRQGVPIRRRRHYFPHVVDKAKWADNETEIVQRLVDAGIERAQAAVIWRRIMDSENALLELNTEDPDTGEEHVRGPGFRYSVPRTLTPKVRAALKDFMVDDLAGLLHNYSHAAVKIGVHAGRFGGAPEKVSGHPDMSKWDPLYKVHAGLKRALDRGQLTVEQYDRVTAKILPSYLGQLGADQLSPTIRSMMSGAYLYQNVRLLPLAVLSSQVDMGQLLNRAGLKHGGRGVRRAFSKLERPQLEELGRLLGIIEDRVTDHVMNEQLMSQHLSPRVQRLNERFFRLTLMQQWTNFTRLAALAAGQEYFQDHARRAQAGDAQSARWLDELGVTPEQVTAWFDAGQPAQGEAHRAMLDAMDRFVNEAIMRPDTSTRPTWGSDHRFMLIWHLKSFMWTFHKDVLERVFHEVRRRQGVAKVLPLLTLGLALLPFAMLGYELRKLITLSGDNPHHANMSAPEYLWEVTQRAGMMGILQTMVDAKQAADYRQIALFSAMGPSVTQLSEFWIRDFDSWLERAVPVVSSNLLGSRDVVQSVF